MPLDVISVFDGSGDIVSLYLCKLYHINFTYLYYKNRPRERSVFVKSQCAMEVQNSFRCATGGEKYCEVCSLLLTEAVQVVALFSKELATSCESLPDFLTLNDIFYHPTKQMMDFGLPPYPTLLLVLYTFASQLESQN